MFRSDPFEFLLNLLQISLWHVNIFQIYFVIVGVAVDTKFAVPKRYPWKIFEQNTTVAYFKNQPSEVFCKKKCLKVLPICQENTCVGVFFNRFTGLKAWSFLKKRLQHMYFSSEICETFESTYFEVHLCTSAFVSSGNFIYNAWKDTANEAWLKSSQTHMMELFGVGMVLNTTTMQHFLAHICK